MCMLRSALIVHDTYEVESMSFILDVLCRFGRTTPV